MKKPVLCCTCVLLVLGSLACARQPATSSSQPVRVLFIGNSYTQYNGTLPALLNQMAEHAGVALEARGSLRSGKSLQWHYQHGSARAAIARGGWDFVVLQDHSRQTVDHPQKFQEYAQRFNQKIARTGAATVFFLTWARQHQPEKQPIITRAYEQAAGKLGALVAPVGEAWQRVRRERSDLPLYFEDQSHPTPAGTYLAACVFYRVLLDQPPPDRAPVIRNERTGKKERLPQEVARYLRLVAEAVAPPCGTPDRR